MGAEKEIDTIQKGLQRKITSSWDHIEPSTQTPLPEKICTIFAWHRTPHWRCRSHLPQAIWLMLHLRSCDFFCSCFCYSIYPILCSKLFFTYMCHSLLKGISCASSSFSSQYMTQFLAHSPWTAELRVCSFSAVIAVNPGVCAAKSTGLGFRDLCPRSNFAIRYVTLGKSLQSPLLNKGVGLNDL